METTEALSRVRAPDYQVRINVQHLHSHVTARVARISLQKGSEPVPEITPQITHAVLPARDRVQG